MNKLLETTIKFPQTQIWNDSCHLQELSYAIENGACGATTNPVIVLNVLKKELARYEEIISTLIDKHPTFSEDEIAWEVIEHLGLEASSLLKEQFIKTNGQKGRISFQTNAKFYNDSEKLINHGIKLSKVVDNAQIKLPVSYAGIKAFEELTFLGISVNATVCFSVAQALAVAKAIEKGLTRRKAMGLKNDHLNPVCTIMVGRLDDYLKKFVKDNHLLIEPEALEWAGVLVAKKVYQLFQKNNYQTKLLVAAYRNPYHFQQFIGGDLVLTIPYYYQKLFNQSDYEIKETINDNTGDIHLKQLLKLEEFIKAYYEEGLKMTDFDHYGAFKITLEGFLKGYDELVSIIRTRMLK